MIRYVLTPILALIPTQVFLDLVSSCQYRNLSWICDCQQDRTRSKVGLVRSGYHN